MTLATNVGYVITHDRAALARWQRRHRNQPQDAGQFRAAVGRLASLFPEKVRTH